VSKDTDGCAKDERGKGSVEVVDWTSPEAKKLFRRVRLHGFSNDDIRRIIAEEDSPQAVFNRLTALADPGRACPKLPPLPPHLHERELEPHEEQIFLETLEGGHQPVTTVG
jgi:hypothetical protein